MAIPDAIKTNFNSLEKASGTATWANPLMPSVRSIFTGRPIANRRLKWSPLGSMLRDHRLTSLISAIRFLSGSRKKAIQSSWSCMFAIRCGSASN